MILNTLYGEETDNIMTKNTKVVVHKDDDFEKTTILPCLDQVDVASGKYCLDALASVIRVKSNRNTQMRSSF